jgi:phosphate/sulfate permease
MAVIIPVLVSPSFMLDVSTAAIVVSSVFGVSVMGLKQPLMLFMVA